MMKMNNKIASYSTPSAIWTLDRKNKIVTLTFKSTGKQINYYPGNSNYDRRFKTILLRDAV